MWIKMGPIISIHMEFVKGILKVRNILTSHGLKNPKKPSEHIPEKCLEHIPYFGSSMTLRSLSKLSNHIFNTLCSTISNGTRKYGATQSLALQDFTKHFLVGMLIGGKIQTP